MTCAGATAAPDLAYRDEKGKVRIHQAVSLTAAGAASGALWGTLIGMLFLMPVAGLAIGPGPAP